MADDISIERKSIIATVANRFNMEPSPFEATVRAVCMPANKEVSREQMAAFLIVCEEHRLNPLTREIFALPTKQGTIIPVVSVDGWSRIINEQPALDGIEFVYSPQTTEFKKKVVHEWVECIISRKDRAKPLIVREYFDEVSRDLSYDNPWNTHPKRMHRHKVLIQCARYAFGFGGIYDEDEAHRIIEGGSVQSVKIATPKTEAPDQNSAPILQGEEGWADARIGCVTASRVADIIARTKTGPAASRANYAAQLVAERLTGNAADNFINSAMQWGLDNEPKAREAYQLLTSADVGAAAFVLHPTIEWAGASPDGFIGEDGLVEFKCPNTATHIDTISTQTAPEKYVAQMQWQMACTGRQWCDFVSFDPRLPEGRRIFIKRVPRDVEAITKLEGAVREFLQEVEATVKGFDASQDEAPPKPTKEQRAAAKECAQLLIDAASIKTEERRAEWIARLGGVEGLARFTDAQQVQLREALNKATAALAPK